MKVSTISPCFRMQKYIKLFLEKLSEQTLFADLQIVLDYNEPSDEELKLVEEFSVKYPGKIKLLISNPVVPIGTSMNRCIENSDGQYLCIWNVDDLRTHHSIEVMAKALDENPDIDFVYGNYTMVNSFGSRDGAYLDTKVPSETEYTRGMVIGPFFMFRKSILEKTGMFDEQLVSGADFDFAVRLGIHGKGMHISDHIGYYLNEGAGASTRANSKQPLERTVVELRYGIMDKFNQWGRPYEDEARKYDINHIVVGGITHPISQYVPNYSKFIEKNSHP